MFESESSQEVVRAGGAASQLSWRPVRREEAYFGQRELALIYIAKKLKEAQELEIVLDAAGLDYLVETDMYLGGFLFRSERIGAFFYVTDETLPAAKESMQSNGYVPYNPLA
jgi:hypothetical protein